MAEEGGAPIIVNSMVIGNVADDHGGGIFVFANEPPDDSAYMDIYFSLVPDNEAVDGDGGGIWQSGGELWMLSVLPVSLRGRFFWAADGQGARSAGVWAPSSVAR